jgi:glycosyltransferase involved in cell wall biosynthesis
VNRLRIILVLTDPPLPFGSAAARWYHVLLKGLVERGHQVTALAACNGPAEVAETGRLFPRPAYNLRLYPYATDRSLRAKCQTLRQPYGYIFSPALRQDLKRELSGDFDLLHLEQLWSGWLGLQHVDRALLNIHYLYDIDLASVPAGSPANLARRVLTSRAERRLLRKYPTLCTLTPRLAERLQQMAPDAAVHTVSLGLDLSLYPFSPHTYGSSPLAPVVSLIGSFHWQPSISAAVRLLTRLWPEIKRRVPEARLQVVGREARAALRQFRSLPDVRIEENVPDIVPYFQATDVLLYAPKEGSGMKVKVLEAFALGVPVVTNRAGVEGLLAEDGVHAGICEDDAGLIERTVTLLRQDKLRDQQRRAARALVEGHCSPKATLDGIEQVYKTATRARVADGRLDIGAPTRCASEGFVLVSHRLSRSWRRDGLAVALCVLLGVTLSILPHLLWWPQLGAPIWIADNDDLLYLSYAAQAYDNHPARLTDPILPAGGRAMYPWLQFVPGVLIARAFDLGPMTVSLIWRLWAGVSIALAWYLVIRHHVPGAFWTAVVVAALLADCGLLTGHLLIRQWLVFCQVSSGHGAELLAGKPEIHPEWRIISPGLSLAFLLIYIWSLGQARRQPSGPCITIAGLAFGLMFYVYFYYWTAALLGLAIAAVLDGGYRKVYFDTGWIGGLVGIPAVLSGYVLKQATLPDWSLRNDYFLPIPRFSELLMPKLAILLLAVGLVWVWRRRKDLLFLWALAAAGLLLANHQVVTGLQINNFHWSYLWGPAVSLLLVLLVVGELSRLPCPRSAAWAAVLLAAGHVGAGVWLRAVEAIQTREGVQFTNNYRNYSSQRLQTASVRLLPNAVVAGDKGFVDLAAILENQRPLYHYVADLSPAVSDGEWNLRIALNSFLLGLDRAAFALEQEEAVAGWVLGPWPRDPAKQAELYEARLASYDRIAAEPLAAVNRFGVRYVALPAARCPSNYLRSGWNCVEAGPYWCIWERRQATGECSGY